MASEPVLPPESFKVHPGLVGLPVPPELQPAVEKNIRREAERDETVMLADAVRVPEDEAGLRTQTRFYFDEGQSQVKPEFAALLTAHGRYLATHPKLRAR
ncbi:MAG: hypothetical protein LBC37_04090, partial [Zoogloeaceae bacterium]|nr:hypothetical protein [Zoogloeaceae bacterium]